MDGAALSPVRRPSVHTMSAGWTDGELPTRRSRLQPLLQLGDLVVDLLALAHEAADLLHGMDDGRVVTAAEDPGDAVGTGCS